MTPHSTYATLIGLDWEAYELRDTNVCLLIQVLEVSLICV